MVNLYDIGRDKNLHPALIKITEYDIKRKSLYGDYDLSVFARSFLKLDMMDNEHMYLVAYDYYNNALGVFLLTIGDYKNCEIYRRNIAECIILSGARKFKLIHNHPDGNLNISEPDEELAEEVNELAELFGVEFMGNYSISYRGMDGTMMDFPIIFDDKKEM